MSCDLFEIRVACFIFNKNKELLLLKNKRGTWGILGGHLDKEEQIEETVHREAKEEANINIKIIKQFGLEVKNDSFIINFACKYKKGKIKLEKEKLGFKWIKLNELKTYDLTFKELPSLAKKAQKIVFTK